MISQPGQYLSDDFLIAEVLPRLSVKALFRFRSVSKTWHQVIATTSFFKTHLTYHKKYSSTKYILHERFPSSCTLLATLDSVIDTIKKYIIPREYTTENNLYRSDYWGLKIDGICDGLLCFSKREYRIGENIYLWNPTCQKIKKLPEIDISTEDGVFFFTRIASVSFGYYNEDYKVIVIAPIGIRYIVCVYSLSTNSWNTICPNMHHCIFYEDDDNAPIKDTKFVDGTAYMITSAQVIYFHLSDETVRSIDLPTDLNRLGHVFTTEAYGETIAVFGCGYSCPLYLTMWILKDKSSSKSSWEKKVAIDLRGGSYFRGVGFLNNGKYVVKIIKDKESTCKLFLCDLDFQKLSEIGDDIIISQPGGRIHSNYVESLFLLNEDRLDSTFYFK